MAREILRLAQSLYNKPHLVTGGYLNSVVEYLEDRNSGKVELAVNETLTGRVRELNYNPDTKIGWVSMEGPLTYIQYEGLCGPSGPSYQTIRDEVKQMLSSGAKYIVLDQDSPGGEAYQAFETAKFVRQEADKYGAKVIAYVDGMSASASYVFSSVADEVIMNPQAEVGSIGVVVKLRNMNEAMKKAGVEDTYIYAGDSKVPFDADGKFTPEFLDDIQEKVNALYVEFAQHVSTMRGISYESVVATQAKTFMADQAIQLGLADKKMTLSEFAEYLADISQSGGNMPIGNLFKQTKNEVNPTMSVNMAKLEELQTQLSQYEAQLSTLQASLEEMGGVKAALEAALGEKETALADAQALVAKLEEEKVEQKLQARKDKLAAVTSADQVEALAASLSSLDDAAFSTVVGAMAAQAKALENSEMFTEVGDQGVEASVEDVAAPKTSTTDALIQARLQNR